MAKKVRVIETCFIDELLEYRGRDVAQPVMVINHETRTIAVDTRFRGDARTFAEEDGDVVVLDIPMLRGDTANRLMHEVAEIFSEDSDAMDQIEAIIDGYEPDLEFWFADDWFHGEQHGITAETTDEEIQDFVKIEELAAGGIIIGCAEYLEELRDALKAE